MRFQFPASIMKKPDVLDFKVGQLAEMRTFEDGFRGAWFRCKIHDILWKKNKILLEYYEFELEDISWANIYKVPPYGRKSKHIKRQLMVRPEYPVTYHKNEMPPVNSISKACVVINDTWKVGDLVDWYKDDCYWSGRIVKVWSDEKVQIELPMPPSGEGGKHEAFCKDLRPTLHWLETKGWTFPTVEGQTSCDAQLIFPAEQAMDLEDEHVAVGSPVNASSSTRISVEGERDGESEQNVNMKMDLEVEHAAAAAAGGSPVNASSTTRTSGEGNKDGESEQNEKNMKMDCDLLVESAESSSSLRVGKGKASDEVEVVVEERKLNIMHDDTLEAAIIDLEELVNKVKWMQRLLQSPSNDSTSSWKFA